NGVFSFSIDGKSLFETDGNHFLRIFDYSTGKIENSIGAHRKSGEGYNPSYDRIALPLDHIQGVYQGKSGKYTVIIKDPDSLTIIDLTRMKEDTTFMPFKKLEYVNCIVMTDNDKLLLATEE